MGGDDLMFAYAWLTRADERGVAEIVDLVATVSASEPFVGLPSKPTADETALLRTKLLGGLSSKQTHLLAVRDAEFRTVGCVAMNRPATANQRHIGELTTGAVHPDYRSQRMVYGVFVEIVRRCQQVGIEVLRLDVREGVRAERLWRFYGFEEYGRLADYGRTDGESYTGIYLAQTVDRLKKRVAEREVAHAQQG